MKTLILFFALLGSGATIFAADEPLAGKPVLIADSAVVLADAVIKASGGDKWPRVKSIEFTFNVANGKPIMSAKHHWDVAKNTDTVEWSGKTVTVNLSGQNGEADAKAGFQRWTNDSYWLLAPLKLRDHGTHLADKGEQQIDGKTYRVLQMSFESVGMTPKDKYNFYIDPATDLIARWDYMPTPQKTVNGTWENYQDFGGL